MPLHDDGPISMGGHEAEGQVAGDHIFSVEVILDDNAVPATFDYGITDDSDSWLWPEGSTVNVSTTAGQTGRVEASGYAIPAHGTIALLFSVDTGMLDASFLPFGSSVAVKTDAIGWRS